LSMSLNRWHPYFLPMIHLFLSKRVKEEYSIYYKLIAPLVIERRSQPKSKHEDVLQWMIDGATGEHAEIGQIVQTMLLLVRSTMGPTSISLVQACYDLCAMPDTKEMLKQEVQQELQTDGWTNQALHRMRKLDSFLKESQRLNQMGLCQFSPRKILWH
jgi:cytochrome P450